MLSFLYIIGHIYRAGIDLNHCEENAYKPWVHGVLLALGNYVKERNKRNIDLIRAIVETEKKMKTSLFS